MATIANEDRLNEVERYRWDRFRIVNSGAKKYYIKCTETGIGQHFEACAKFFLKTKRKDITDYDCW